MGRKAKIEEKDLPYAAWVHSSESFAESRANSLQEVPGKRKQLYTMLYNICLNIRLS